MFSPDGPSADGDYVLAVGTLEPRKNLERAAEAASRAGVELRVVGARGWGGVTRRTASAGSARSATTSSRRLLRGARALVYPSLYEGFGIPILEAMSVGTPVVTSGAARPRRWPAAPPSSSTRSTLPRSRRASPTRDRRRDELRALGLARARSFSWDDVGRRTVEVYEAAAVIVLDADVLGRGRTGDETYVANLLRALAASRGDLRIAAITRDACSCPTGSSRSC